LLPRRLILLFAFVLTILRLSTASSSSSSPSTDNSSNKKSQEKPEDISTISSCLAIPTVPLANGVEMPLLQLGTANLIETPNTRPWVHSNFQGMLPELTFRQTELALRNGIRAFDTAYIYRSQPAMGAVLGEWFRTGQLTDRRNLWITTKIFHPDATSITFGISHLPFLHEMTPAQVTQAVQQQFEECLKELHLGYVDLILLHWPSGKDQGTEQDNRQRRLAAWKVLEQVYAKGWARSIGVSNFAPKHIEQLKTDGAQVLPMVNQFEASIILQYPDILEYCQQNNIVAQAYSPLGRGVTEMPSVVADIAQRHGKDVGQVSFRYLYQLGYAITYLTTSETRMISNTEIFDFELSDDEMKQLASLRRQDGSWGLPSPHELD